MVLTFQKLVSHIDVRAQEVHRKLAKLVKDAGRPVLPDAEGEI